MIEEKNIKKAAKAYDKKVEGEATKMCNGEPYDHTIHSVGGFEAGAKWALAEVGKNLWHRTKVSEEPEESVVIFVKDKDFSVAELTDWRGLKRELEKRIGMDEVKEIGYTSYWHLWIGTIQPYCWCYFKDIIPRGKEV